MPAVVVEGLRKEYGPLTAVDGLTFSINESEIFALLGPNGAGKTTTVEILEGHRKRSDGSVSVLGYDPETGGREFHERIGIVLQEAGFDEDFTPRELVTLYGRMYPRRLSADDVIELAGLSDKRNARVRTLSGGQRRRLDLALGLVGDPDLLFLDEPTTGFDPSARRKAWELIDGLRAMGKTVLLTTHYMDEAEHLADRVAVIVRGTLIALGTPAELQERQHGSVVSFRLPEGTEPPALPDLGGAFDHDGQDWELETEHPTHALCRLTDWAEHQGIEFPSLTVTRPTLEDTYLELVGEADGDGNGRVTEAKVPEATA